MKNTTKKVNFFEIGKEEEEDENDATTAWCPYGCGTKMGVIGDNAYLCGNCDVEFMFVELEEEEVDDEKEEERIKKIKKVLKIE